VNHAVMKHHRLLDDVINYDKGEFLRNGRIRFGALRDFRRTLRVHAFDLAIVPATVSMSLTSDILAYFSGARWRIGPGSLEGKGNPGAFLYTHPVDLSWADTPDRHQTLRNIDVCRGLSVNTSNLELEMTLLPEEMERGAREVAAIRAGVHTLVAFHAGAGKVPNRWPPESFAGLIRELYCRRGARIVIVKGPMDNEPVEHLTSMLGVPYYLIENRSIREIASILSLANLLISNDTGIMHVGAAAGSPVLSLFGPTSPNLWAPPGAKHRYIGSPTGVISDIPVSTVLEAALQMLPEHD